MRTGEPPLKGTIRDVRRGVGLLICNRDYGRRMLRVSVTCVFAILVIAASTESSAQYTADTITLFSDPSGDSCTLIDDQEGPLSVYVINESRGLVDSRFRIASSEGFNADYVSEVIHMPFYIGDLRAGIDIGYGYCATGTLLLATITYMGHGIKPMRVPRSLAASSVGRYH